MKNDPSKMYAKNQVYTADEVHTASNFYEKSAEFPSCKILDYTEWQAYRNLMLEPETDSTID